MGKVFLFIALIIASANPAVSQGGLNEKIDWGVIALTIDGTHAYIGWRLVETSENNVNPRTMDSD